MFRVLLYLGLCSVCTVLLPHSRLAAQPVYDLVRANWQDAGHRGPKPSFSHTVDLLQFGADSTGATPSNTAFAAAVAALGYAPGVILIPSGTYYFNAPLLIGRDSIIIRGTGYQATRLQFNLGHSPVNAITLAGNTAAGDAAMLTLDAVPGQTAVAVSSTARFTAGDWVRISMDDRAYMTSSWAYGSLSQLLQISSIRGDTLTFSTPFRFRYTTAGGARLDRIIPRREAGIECLQVQRLDSTAGQSSNIVFEQAVNCWLSGIASDTTNFAHAEVNRSSNIEITNSYFHHAFAYGGNGQGYGVLLQFGSGECKVEGNYFSHLRHAILLQAGANGNVAAYNYAADPFWSEPGLPAASAGELVLHGNYPFANLFEGNLVQNIVIDDSHGRNGPYNTFLRNRAAGYGVFMNFNPPTDSVQFIGNEVTSAATGLFYLAGTGHLVYGNNRNGTLTSGTAAIPDTSLYLGAGTRPPCMDSYPQWPVTGAAGHYNTGSIYARERALAGRYAACDCLPLQPAAVKAIIPPGGSWRLYPNPAAALVTVAGEAVETAVICDAAGRPVDQVLRPAGNKINTARLPAGLYFLKLIGKEHSGMLRFLKL